MLNGWYQLVNADPIQMDVQLSRKVTKADSILSHLNP